MKKIVLICSLLFVGCGYDITINENEDVIINNGNFQTIDGDYRVHIIEESNDCNLDNDDPLNTWATFRVIVQEKSNDDSYLADFYSLDLWWESVEIDSSGEFYNRNTTMRDYILEIEGIIAPDTIDATITIQTPSWEPETPPVCTMVFNIYGYALYDRSPPPEDFEDR